MIAVMKYSRNRKGCCVAVLALALTLLGGCAETETDSGPEAEGALASEEAEGEELSLKDALALAADTATTQYFTDEALPQPDIETILLAGVNAPSAMNGQPWHFAAVTDTGVLEQISEDMSAGLPAGDSREDKANGETDEGLAAAPAKAGIADAPLAIVISCKEGSEFDAGLACQAMSCTDQLLGYGTKVISSPTIALNGEKQQEYRDLLGIPEDCSAVAVLLVGCEDVSVDETLDGYAGATERSPLEQMATYVTAAE